MTDTPKPSNRVRPLHTLTPGYQPRDKEHEQKQVAFLTACFAQLGERQCAPVTILRDGTIVDGHCRVQALKAAGIPDVWVSVWAHEQPPTREEVQAINTSQSTLANEAATETLQRWTKLIQEHGWTVEQLAEATGRSQEIIRKRVARWLRIPEPVKQKLREEKASALAIDAEAAKVTKQKHQEHAGTVDKWGRVRSGKPVLQLGGGTPNCKTTPAPTPPTTEPAAPSPMEKLKDKLTKAEQERGELKEQLGVARYELKQAQKEIARLKVELEAKAEAGYSGDDE